MRKEIEPDELPPAPKQTDEELMAEAKRHWLIHDKQTDEELMAEANKAWALYDQLMTEYNHRKGLGPNQEEG